MPGSPWNRRQPSCPDKLATKGANFAISCNGDGSGSTEVLPELWDPREM